jgi:hypothetical protein
MAPRMGLQSRSAFSCRKNEIMDASTCLYLLYFGLDLQAESGVSLCRRGLARLLKPGADNAACPVTRLSCNIHNLCGSSVAPAPGTIIIALRSD